MTEHGTQTRRYKTALVTGGARRIGAAIVADLAAHGFAVAIHHRQSARDADTLAAGINSAGGKAVAIAANLADIGETQALFEAARRALGPVDLIVNNASFFERDDAQHFDAAKWEAHFAIHARAPAQLASLMNAQDDLEAGHIVNIIDQRVWRLTPNYFSYSLSKSALWTQTQMLAQALAPKIRVNAIGPGPTLKSDRQRPEDFAAQIDGLLLKRGPKPDEFGATIRYLCDMESVTGQMIALDGGQHLAWETPDIAGIPE